jgi:hypothetical protein
VVAPQACQHRAEAGTTGGRIRFLGDRPLPLPDVVLAALRQLVTRTQEEPSTLVDATTELTAVLGQTVSGFAGLRITVVHSDVPVTLALVAPGVAGPAATSVAVPLLLLSADHRPGGRVVLYSSVPGAFVDLAADLAFVLDRRREAEEHVELDADLPLPATSGLTGLDDLATLHRALGHLIDQGHHPDTVEAALRSLASAAGVAPLAFARLLLRS